MATKRVLGIGFSTVEGGMDGGKDASLIAPNQVAALSNFSNRGSLLTTRNPLESVQWTDLTGGRFTGRFQGSMFYEAESGTSGFILAVGGKLFRIQFGYPNTLTEITPKLSIVVVDQFSVPSPGDNVTIDVTSETPFTVGETVFIDSGQYTVLALLAGQLQLQYISSAAGGTAPQGAAVLDVDSNQVFQYLTLPPNQDMVFMFQAENYAIILGGQQKTIIYDGATARQAGINELPPAVFGLYAWGRIWLTLNDRRTFIAGDIVYGPSGTPQNGFRDAILKVTENTFLNEGGVFGVPNNAGPITSMFALATQDTSLGIGNILIGTTNSVISCNAPPDRTTWKNLTYPIQTISLLDEGPQGPWAVTSVNGDAWYRGASAIRSFIVARRDINVWGNTPVSREVSPILDKDSKALLPHASNVYFDNRLFTTVAPYLTQYGTAHRGLVVINYDTVSDLRQKQPAAWEGTFSGLQFLQVLKGRLDNIERGFTFALDGANVELWEIKTEGTYDLYNTPGNIKSTGIQSFLETRRDNFNDSQQLKNLYTSEIFIDDIVDDVMVCIKYRPDEYPQWTEWATLEFCASVSQCKPPNSEKFSCLMWKTNKNTYAARVLLTTPEEVENRIVGGYLSVGYEFQFRIEVTGHCRIRKWLPQGTIVDDRSEGEQPTQNPECISFTACDLDTFAYSSYGMRTEFSGTYTIPNGADSGTVTGLNLGFSPSKILVGVVSPDSNSLVLTVNATSSLSSDGFKFIMSGQTDGPCYILNYTLKM